MHTRTRDLLPLSVLLAVGLLAVGCDSGGGSGSTPVGPDIRGKWSGSFYSIRLDPPRRQPVTATIQQDGDAVIIKTSRTGTGANLTGTIDAKGNMKLTDAFDGELWTTYYGPATATRVRILDFLYDDDLGGESPLVVLDFKREAAAAD